MPRKTIASQILAGMRERTAELAAASAAKHNPPTIHSVVKEQRSAYELGERYNSPCPMDAPHFAPDVSYDDVTIGLLLKGESKHSTYVPTYEPSEQEDEANRDPRWNTNRETRGVRATPIDQLATLVTGIDPEPMPTNGVMHGPDPLPAASEMTTRKARTYRILVDRANRTVLVQRQHAFGITPGLHSIGSDGSAQETHLGLITGKEGEPEWGYEIYRESDESTGTSSFKTVWRESAATVAEAFSSQQAWALKLAARGDRTLLGDFKGTARVLVTLDARTVYIRPDFKGSKVIKRANGKLARETYPTLEEAKAAYHRILNHQAQQGAQVRGWVTPKQEVAA